MGSGADNLSRRNHPEKPTFHQMGAGQISVFSKWSGEEADRSRRSDPWTSMLWRKLGKLAGLESPMDVADYQQDARDGLGPLRCADLVQQGVPEVHLICRACVHGTAERSVFRASLRGGLHGRE